MQPEPGLALLPEPIALALDHEGVAVMQESIEDGGGDDVVAEDLTPLRHALIRDRKSTRLNSSHRTISYAVVCLKKKKQTFVVFLSKRWRAGCRDVPMLPSELGVLR